MRCSTGCSATGAPTPEATARRRSPTASTSCSRPTPCATIGGFAAIAARRARRRGARQQAARRRIQDRLPPRRRRPHRPHVQRCQSDLSRLAQELRPLRGRPSGRGARRRRLATRHGRDNDPCACPPGVCGLRHLLAGGSRGLRDDPQKLREQPLYWSFFPSRHLVARCDSGDRRWSIEPAAGRPPGGAGRFGSRNRRI